MNFKGIMENRDSGSRGVQDRPHPSHASPVTDEVIIIQNHQKHKSKEESINEFRKE